MKKDELKKCYRITDAAIKGYLNLIKQKELFEQSLNLSSSIQNSISTDKVLLSIITVQDTLYSYLVMELHSWLFDQSEGLGMRPLLSKLKNEHSIKLIRQHITRIPTAISLDGKDHSQFYLPHVKHLEAEFDKNIEKCICTYEKLLDSELFTRFDLLRRKYLAHKDKNFSIAENKNMIGDVIEITKAMRELVLLFNKLFQKSSYDLVFASSENAAKERAIEFWNIFLSKN